MENHLIITVIIIIIIFIIIYFIKNHEFNINQTVGIISTVDGKMYKVHTKHPNPQKAANTFAELNRRITNLIKFLSERYNDNSERCNVVRKLISVYNSSNLIENSPKNSSGDTSYTINKGSIIAICLRDPLFFDIHNIDILTFVLLHEMVHIAIIDIDHPEKFWSTFRFILEEAEKIGIYTRFNFELQPVFYCGLKVDYNPLLDPTIRPI